MEVKAVAKYVKVQPRKVRIVADEVRGSNALRSANQLRFHTSKGAKELRKVLLSAIANAENNNGMNADQLRIATIMVDEGPRQKRMQARAMGRGNRIIKKTSHITVVVEDYEGETRVKPHGTKAKARPTFAAPKKGKKSEAKAEEAAAVVAEEAVVEEPKAEEVVEETAAVAEEAVVEEAPAAEAAAEEAAVETTEETKEDATQEGEK